MREGYEAPDINTTMAQRQAADTQEAFVQFTSVRTLPGSASAAFSFGAHASRPSSGAVGDGYFETDRNWLYYYSGTAWKYEAGINVGTDATRAAITVTANDNGALFWTTDTGLLWRVEAGAWAEKTSTSAATGWTTDPTGTLNRTTFVSDTVLLPDLAARVAALIIDLRTKKVLKA